MTRQKFGKAKAYDDTARVAQGRVVHIFQDSHFRLSVRRGGIRYRFLKNLIKG